MRTKRKSIRFKCTPLSTALLDFSEGKSFVPMHSAIIANESYTGCALVLISNSPVTVEQKLKIKVNEFAILRGQVVWCRTLEENIQKLGIEFID